MKTKLTIEIPLKRFQSALTQTLELPPPYKFLTIGNQAVFPVYGNSGGLSLESIAYVVHHLAEDSLGDMGLFGLHTTNGSLYFGVKVDDLFAVHVDEAINSMEEECKRPEKFQEEN